MGIVLFLLYLFLCLGAYSLFLILFKNRYTTYYQLDDIIDTNDETYAVYLPENRWKEYIKDYTVYINDEYRFLKFELTDKVQYININIICYRDKKIKRIISFLNEIDVKQEHFIIKLPDNCDEIKLNVVEVNGNPYFEDSNIKCDVLWRSIVSSLILGFSAVLMLFIFRLAAMGFENSYFNWNHIYELFFYEPWTYIAGICFALILAVSLFLILYLSNNLKFKKARFNKIKKLKIDKVLKTVDLFKEKDKKFKNFSLGMKQRLGIAFAILDNPDFIILDEPINGLDPIGIKEIRDTLKRLNEEEKITILISSHILSELYLIANHFCFIDKGRIIKDLSKEELDLECSKCIVIKTKDVKKATVVLEQELKTTNYKVIDNTEIRLYDYLENTLKVNKTLLANDIEVMGIYESGISLEDYFDSLIKDGAK